MLSPAVRDAGQGEGHALQGRFLGRGEARRATAKF